MLLTGDLDDPDMLEGQDVDVELLKSPHHGSRTGNTDRLFEMTGPDYVVVMGRYPTPAGLEQRLEHLGDRYVNTRADGGAVLRFGGGEPVLERYRRPRAGRWECTSSQNRPGMNRK
jgi:beta-lactamase superfamily II metal-dependent hydrolase